MLKMMHKKKNKKKKLMLKDKREKFDAVPTQKIARKYSVKVPKGWQSNFLFLVDTKMSMLIQKFIDQASTRT